MKRCLGHHARHDDEWYTPAATAAKIAGWLAQHLPRSTPILCPADVLPDGRESAIPGALRAHFARVRVTRDLPIAPLYSDWRPGEVIVTNPPFSLLVPFRAWLDYSQARYCVLARLGVLPRAYSLPVMGTDFRATDGRRCAACWAQNLVDTTTTPPARLVVGDCALCERLACPRNSMTRGLCPGEHRPLYTAAAIRYGLGGWWCSVYTTAGRRAYLRFFNPGPAQKKSTIL